MIASNSAFLFAIVVMASNLLAMASKLIAQEPYTYLFHPTSPGGSWITASLEPERLAASAT